MRDITPYTNTQPPASSPANRELLSEEWSVNNLRLYKVALLKFRWTILLVSFAAVSLAVLSVVLREPVYTAEVTLQIQGQTPNVTGVAEAFALGSGNGILAGNYDYYQTQFNILKSKSLVARVIKELDLEHDSRFRAPENLGSWGRTLFDSGLRPIVSWFEKTFAVSNQETRKKDDANVFEFGVPPWSISRYRSMLTISPVSKSQLVQVQFSSISPDLARKVANAHATAYIRMSLQTRFELTREAQQFLEDKLGELKVKVEKSEAALNNFRKLHKVVP
jgi:uncharacterized protein involved in exopolysaccharide biosynthesis